MNTYCRYEINEPIGISPWRHTRDLAPVVYDSFQESLEPLSKSVLLQEINDPHVVYTLIGAQSNVFSLFHKIKSYVMGNYHVLV